MKARRRQPGRGVAFDSGKIIADGPVADVLARPAVRRAVLGED